MPELLVPAKKNIYDASYIDLSDVINTMGEPQYRTDQLWKGVYVNLWDSLDHFTNIPAELRRKLNDYFEFQNLDPKVELTSKDKNTTKILFQLKDGYSIESVLMSYDRRQTLCISTQAGCAMGCVFCATGQMGFKRHLTNGEIIEQILFFARRLKSQGSKVTNIVMMGMGEPFHNYQNTIQAINCLNEPGGYNFGERRFTISTVGIIPMIKKFALEKRQINLAISLHAPNDELRSSMLPINKKYPITDLIAACKEYISLTHRRITFEYALVDGVNDSPQLARELAKLLRGMICHVNLIPLNPTRQYNGKGSTPNNANEFLTILMNAGIPCTLRLRRGIDIQAGCGQLAIQSSETSH